MKRIWFCFLSLGLGAPLAAASVCSEAVQGKIAWDYKGSKGWGQGNLNKLCSGAADSVEPARCFERVMHGGVSYGSGTQWRWQNALNLCKGSLSAERTVGCFEGQIRNNKSWTRAIEACGDYSKLSVANVISSTVAKGQVLQVLGQKDTPGPVDRPTSPSRSLEERRPEVSLDTLVRVTPSPADAVTRTAVSNAGRATARPGVRPHPGIRVTNPDGWYDLVMTTASGPTYGICSNACFETEGCKAFVVEGPKNQPGGFCGLVTDAPHRRYDRAWVGNSREFTSYTLGGVANVDSLDMVGSRTVALTLMLGQAPGQLRSANLKQLIDTKKTFDAGGKGLAECATRCMENEACAVFAANPGRKECLTFKDSGASGPLSRHPIHVNGTVVGFMARFDKRPRDRQKFFKMFEPETGLGLFSIASVNLIRKFKPSLANYVEPLSAGMHTRTDGIWSGEAPPVAEVMLGDGEVEVEGQDLAGIFAREWAGQKYLPFQEMVWRSKTESGIYYFAPTAYWFDWNPSESRLGGSQFFNAAGALEDGRDVRMQIHLSGSYESSDLDTLRELVEAHIAKRRLPPLKELKRFPVEGKPRLEISAGLSGFAGSIDTHSNASEMAAPFDLVFSVDELSAKALIENFVSAEGQPINGELYFRSSKLDDEILVPITLDPRNTATYGADRVQGDVWINRTPFPVKRVARVHALLVKTDRAEILSWDLNGHEPLEPGRGLMLETGTDFPQKLLQGASRVWVDYEVDRSCRSCVETAMGVGAVSSEARSSVEFAMPQSLVERLDAEEIEIAFKSRFLKPEGGRERLAAPIVLTRDTPSASSPLLYLADDKQLGSDEEAYLYRARLFTLDERELCTEWISSGEPRVRLRQASFSEERCE